MKSAYYNMHHRKRSRIEKRGITCSEQFHDEQERDICAAGYTNNPDYPIFAKVDLDWDAKEAFLYAEEVDVTEFEPGDTIEWYYLCIVDRNGYPYIEQLYCCNDDLVEEAKDEYRTNYMCTLKIVDNGIGDAVVTLYQERKDLFPEEYHAKV